MTLQNQLDALAQKFVGELLSALQTVSLGDLQGTAGAAVVATVRSVSARPPPILPRVHGDRPAPYPTTPSDRLKRRTLNEVRGVVARLTELLAKQPAGLRSEQIRTTLGLDVREVPRILKIALADKAIRILGGQKRSTAYGLRVLKHSPPVKVTNVKKGAPRKVGTKKTGPKESKTPKKAVKAKPKAKAAKAKAAKAKKPTAKRSPPKKTPKRAAVRKPKKSTLKKTAAPSAAPTPPPAVPAAAE